MGKDDKCVACGGYDFSLVDGFMYCDRCGSLLENFEELEEDEMALHGHTVGAAKIKIKKKIDENAPKKKKEVPNAFLKFTKEQRQAVLAEKQSEFLRRQKMRDENLPYDKTPEYLYGVGRRLFAFTEILSKCSFILTNEMHFNPDIKTSVLAVFQKYLAHCQVAFCQEEQCGNNESLRFVAVMENIHYEEEERAEKRRKKLESRGRGVKALSKSAAAWTLLTQGNLTENLELDSDDDDEDPEDVDNTQDETMNDDTETFDNTVGDTTMGFVRKVTTALSTAALRRAGQMTLSMEILVAILSSALWCSGYNNILMTDIIRWIREDRFRIPRRSIKFLQRSMTEPSEELRSFVEYREEFLRLPLFEITRTCTLFHQSLDLTEYQGLMSFEKLASRLIENLNLPVDILTRVLLLESIFPCEISPLLMKQADIKMGGASFQKLSGTHPKMYLAAFMAGFGRKELLDNKNDMDEMILSVDTKVMAYILMALKLTFDLDYGPIASESDIFDIDTWIQQLEMRIKCWQGHDMSMVLRPSCPIPETILEMPFGPHFNMYDKDGVPKMLRLRRTPGFRKTIPSEMSFHSTSNMPTVFDIRENRYSEERRRLEAILSPLQFQTTILRREMNDEPKKFKYISKDSEKTVFEDFKNFKTTEEANSFSEFFPLSKEYSQYARPDWMTDCTARKRKDGASTGPLRFYLSIESADSLYSVASPSFSPRFKFLVENFSLLLGEQQSALYSAFMMLEFQLIASEHLEHLRESLLNSEPIPVDCQIFWGSDHLPMKFGILSENRVERISELKFFKLSKRFFDAPEISKTSESVNFLKSTRNQEIRDDLIDDDENSNFRRMAFDFETFFAILTLKFW